MRENGAGAGAPIRDAGHGYHLPERLTVACLKWGDKYGPEYVTRLRNMVRRHLPVAHDFVCFTEKPVEGIECRPLPSEYPTWWAKIGLFKPGLFTGPVLYLDLDVVLTGLLVPIVVLPALKAGLWARDDFSYSLRNPRQGLSADQKLMLGGDGCVNSSVMLWRGDELREVWDRFDPIEMKVCHGDQNLLSKILGKERINFIPDPLVHSYKYHVMRGEGLAPVVVFHGSPKPDEVGDEWVQRCWT